MKGILILLILINSSLWIRHSLYQGLICTAQGRSAFYCKETVLKNIKKIVVLGKVNHIHLKGDYKKWSGTLNWDFYKWQWNFKQELVLP